MKKLLFVLALALASAPAARADSWALGPGLQVARGAAGLATLHDGSILVVGGTQIEGSSGFRELDSAERYDPTTATWSLVAPTNDTHGGPLARTLDDGRVLIADGTEGEVYDPAADTWTMTNDMSAPRDVEGLIPSPFEIARLGDGKILLAGSVEYPSANADVFDPATAASSGFSSVEDMGTERQAPAEASLPDGRVLVVGGGDAGGHGLTSAEIFNGGAGHWTAVASHMAQPHIAALIAPLPGGKVLITGGASALPGTGAPIGTKDAEVYDPATGQFTQTAAMSDPHLGGFVTPLPDGRVLVGGGVDISGTSGTTVAGTEIYQPSTGTWTSGPPLVRAEAFPAAAPLSGGRVLLAGGFSALTTNGANADGSTQILTPSTAPAAPQAVSAIAGNGSAVVVWAPPASDGGSPVTSYTVTASTGQRVTTPDARGAVQVPGLANGTPVTFTVTATNASGTSPASAPTAAVTPTAPPAPDTTAPTVKVSKLKSKLKRKSFLKGVTATLTPSEPASFVVQLLGSARKATIARTFNLALATKSYSRSASARKIKLTPSRKLVGKARRFTVQLRIVAVDAAGNMRTVTKTIHVT